MLSQYNFSTYHISGPWYYHTQLPNPANTWMFKLTTWHYWWWWWFLFTFTWYYILLVRHIQLRTKDKRSRRATRGMSRARWGDFFTGVYPILWSFMILGHANGMLRLIEESSEHTDVHFKVRGKQWQWKYRYHDDTYLNFIQRPVRHGRLIGNTVKLPRKVLERDFNYFKNVMFVTKYNTSLIWDQKIQDYKNLNEGNIIYHTRLWKSNQWYLPKTRDPRYQFQDNANQGWLRLLQVHKSVCLPVFTNISVVTCSRDVIHSWFIPGMNIKLDCVPGRSTLHVVKIQRTGLYYGQCTEVCGRKHFMMPIMLHAVDSPKFILWWEHFILERYRKKLFDKKKSEFTNNPDSWANVGINSLDELEDFYTKNNVEQYSIKYH